MKIKDVRISKIKLVEHLGEVEPAWTPGTASITSTIGGYDFTEIELDSGEIGIGPGCDEIIIKDSKDYLIGKSPNDVICVGINAGPFTVGPTIAAPICATPPAKND